MEAQSGSPCAGCKFLRRKCQPDCIFAPYFLPEETHKFQIVHRVFGASNVSKLLQEIHPSSRMDAVSSLAYEAEMRLLDPVHGCTGVISILHHQLNQLRTDLNMAKAELFKSQTLGLTNNQTATSSSTTTTHAGPLLQQQNIGTSTINNVACDQFHQQNHQLIVDDKKHHLFRTIGGSSNYATDDDNLECNPPVGHAHQLNYPCDSVIDNLGSMYRQSDE